MKRFFGEPTAKPIDSVPIPRLRPASASAASPAPVATPPATTPVPRLRPDEVATTPAPEAAPTPDKPPAPEIAAAPTLKAAPTPEKAPATEIAAAPEETPAPAPDKTADPKTRIAALPAAPEPELAPPDTPEPSTCGLVMASLGVTSQPLAPIDEGECHLPAPIAVSALDGGTVDLSTKAIVNCSLAETLAKWVRTTVQPVARRTYGDDLTGLRVVDSYACRPRDNIEGAQLSEHGAGNAIDISAFRIGKRWIAVGPGWKAGGDDLAFLTTVRQSACGPFKTVLGPGADSFHTDHFHLDLAARRTSGPSQGLYCR